MLALVVRAADDYTGESAEAAGAYGDTAHAATTGAIALVAVWLPMGPLAPYFKLRHCRWRTSAGWRPSSRVTSG